MTQVISKCQPHRTLYLRGFDRRGCAATLHNASAGGFTCSGVFSDLADFVVLMLFDADDNYGQLFANRYLPDFNLTGVVLDFDLAITNGMYPGSTKYPSVPWGALSYVETNGTRSSTPLNITATTGQVAASATFTLSGTPTTYDRVQIVYLGNVVFDMSSITTGQTLAEVASVIAAMINAATNSVTCPLTATSSGASITITCTQPGQDGNTIELYTMYKTAGNTSIAPPGAVKLTGGVDPTSFHVHLDFSAMGLTSIRQAWLTLAPSLPIDSGSVNPSLVPFTAKEFSYVFSNWTITDPGGVTPLKVAGPGSVVVGSRDSWASYAGAGWAEQSGFFYQGFAQASSNAGDAVTITYSCQSTHDLYLGTYLEASAGTFHVTLDGVAQADRSTALEGGTSADSPFAGRRLLVAGVAAGNHTVVLTVASGVAAYFDYIQAAVTSDVPAAAVTYSNVNAACDFDTGQTYQIPPARVLWNLQALGFTGDLDFYAGVFFALKRRRAGGSFHQATVTITGYGAGQGIGSGFGDGDAIFVDIGGSTFGAAVYPADTLASLAQRLVDGVNGQFVGVCAAPTSTPGQFTITTLSPINGFTLSVYLSTGAVGAVAVKGDINAGNEGTWGVDASQSSPLNRAFRDYLTDLAGLIQAAGQTMTVAFSQELLAPPDANTSARAWCQRFADGTSVLTATGFGSWGAGFVEAVAAGPPITIQWTGHGFITGNTIHLASASGGGVWMITVTDANHFQLTTEISNTGGYSPSVGDSGFIDLQTSQCNFNPATVTAYLQGCYIQAANILAAAGLTPWLQFGEVGWWFFSEISGLTGSPPVPAGGGMAYYDAYTAAAALAMLGRPLASFYTQDDDPTINGGADAAFLAGQIFTHISTIIAAVIAAQAGACFELLYPLDVNFPSCYYTPDMPYPQGGRLNAAVNLPAQFRTQAGSGLDRLKMEGLSWQATYFNDDNFLTTMRFPYETLTWPKSATSLLIAWFNGACPWTRAYRHFCDEGIPILNFWAADHAQLLSWPIPLPANQPTVRTG